MHKFKSFAKRSACLLTAMAILFALFSVMAGVTTPVKASGEAYTPKRVMSLTATDNDPQVAFCLAKAAPVIGYNQTFTVKGYYKVENYEPHGAGASVHIGGAAAPVVGNTDGWVPFSTTYTSTSADETWSSYGMWYANGYFALADVTIENAAGEVVYDMTTDTNLIAGDYAAGTFGTNHQGIWLILAYGGAQHMSGHIDPACYVPERTIGFVATDNDPQIAFCLAKAAPVIGYNQTFTVKGYYMVENYQPHSEAASVHIGGAAAPVVGNTNGWVAFSTTYTSTSADETWSSYGLWYANGTYALADVIIEDADGNVVYDMRSDKSLVAGEYAAGTFGTNHQGIWLILAYGGAQHMSGWIDEAIVDEYVPQRTMGFTATDNDPQVAFCLAKVAPVLGYNKTFTVKGYYKVENYQPHGEGASVHIGAAAAPVVGNTDGWVPFTTTYTTDSTDETWSSYGLWYANGDYALADVTIEDADGKLVYDMRSDKDLIAGEYPAGTFGTQYQGIWLHLAYGGAQHMSGWIDKVYKEEYLPKRTMGFTAVGGDAQVALVLAKAAPVIGYNETFTVKGYYKVENFEKADEQGAVNIGGGAAPVAGNTDGWVAFSASYTTGASGEDWSAYGLWHANGTFALADVIIENAEGEVVYDMLYDSSLVPGEYETGKFGTKYMGIWLALSYNDANHMSGWIDEFEGPPAEPDYGIVEVPACPDFMAADANGYVPNRAFGIVGTTDVNPVVKFAQFARAGYTTAGKYYILANVKVEGFAAHEGATDAMAYIKLGDEIIASYAADTNGWIALTDNAGKPITFDAFAKGSDILSLTFGLNNAAAGFYVADLLIANEKGEIIYSLANDATLHGAGDMRRNSKLIWDGYDSDIENPTSIFPIRTKSELEYVPNNSITLDLKDLTKSTVIESFLYFDAYNEALGITDGNRYIITGKIRVNVTAGINHNISACLTLSGIETVDGVASSISYGSTGGWVSLVYTDGTPITFTGMPGALQKYIKFNFYNAQGSVELADIVITDMQGNVIYDMSKDAELLATNVVEMHPEGSPVQAGQLFRWCRYSGTVADGFVTVNQNPVTHTAEDYKIPVFVETANIPKNPDTGDNTMLLSAGACLILSAVMLGGILLKKKEN